MKCDLQVFIEQNAGKDFGDKYIFGDVFLCTRWVHTIDTGGKGQHCVEVQLILNLINMQIVHCFEPSKVGDNIAFYKWLTDEFSPLVEKVILEHLSTRKREDALNGIMSPEEFKTWLAALPEIPSVEQAKEILKNSEIINPGTDHSFVKGCFGNKYRDAVMVLSSEFQQIKELLEEKG